MYESVKNGSLGDNELKSESKYFSQKEVESMVRLLKVAKLMSESKENDPLGNNYLKSFIEIPQVGDSLEKMRQELTIPETYMNDLKEKFRENRENGQHSNYPLTPYENKVRSESTRTIAMQSSNKIRTIN